jgi:hypothetical protein
VEQINQEGVIIDMFIKKFKRKCDVRGCKNTANVFLVSKRREMGNTIAICTDCLKEAQATIDGYVEEKKTIIKEEKPLFPHPELDVTISSVADEEPKLKEVIEGVTEEFPISVAEDTVAKEEKPKTTTNKPKAPTNSKGKSNKR